MFARSASAFPKSADPTQEGDFGTELFQTVVLHRPANSTGDARLKPQLVSCEATGSLTASEIGPRAIDSPLNRRTARKNALGPSVISGQKFRRLATKAPSENHQIQPVRIIKPRKDWLIASRPLDCFSAGLEIAARSAFVAGASPSTSS